MAAKYLFTIDDSDVGKAVVKGFDLESVMGRILPIDVGKRVYLVGGIIQVENTEQRDKRLGKRS